MSSVGGLRKKLTKSKALLIFCFCFILGVAIFSFANSRFFLFYLYLGLFLFLVLFVIFWGKGLHIFAVSCCLFFVLGGLRFLISIPVQNQSRIEFYNGRKVALQGRILQEPEVGISDVKYVLSAEYLQEDKTPKPVSGRTLIKSRLYPRFNYGDRLEIECFLQEPENFPDSNFNYAKYLAKQGIWSVCANPQINFLETDRGSFFLKSILRLKTAVQNQMGRLWPEPNNSLLAGLLYGSKNGLPKDLLDNFSRTGVSHIVAVSGYNVSIIAMVLGAVLIFLGLSRRQAFWLLSCLILLFVFFTGATASVVRAGIMAMVILLAQYFGRLASAGRALVYAAVIMLGLNPYLLIWDAGFQLSFLSTLGLVYLSPVIGSAIANAAKPYYGVAAPPRNGIWGVLLEIFSTTLSAIIATSPLILFQFGRLSLVAPLVNVLILWLIPWLMLFGFLALIVSFLIFPLGQIIAWIAGLGLSYVIIIVNWFGGKSWSAIEARVPLAMAVVIYLLLIYFVWRYAQKSKNPSLGKRVYFGRGFL